MTRTGPFQRHTAQYDGWFEEYRFVYEAELRAVGSMLPPGKRGLEIGAGTGSFAVPLAIDVGIEPSGNMRARAREKGMNVLGAVAEHLPFRDAAFGFVLMVTTLCFLDDVPASFRESSRVLTDGGDLIIGFVDRTSRIGQEYVRHQHENVFYREATFYSVEEVVDALEAACFVDFILCQTIFDDLPRITEHEEVRPGHGKGSFVVIRGRKQ